MAEILNTHLQQTGLALGPHVQVQAFTTANTFDPVLVIPSDSSMVSDQPTVVTEVVGDGDLSHTSSASDDSGIENPEKISSISKSPGQSQINYKNLKAIDSDTLSSDGQEGCPLDLDTLKEILKIAPQSLTIPHLCSGL